MDLTAVSIGSPCAALPLHIRPRQHPSRALLAAVAGSSPVISFVPPRTFYSATLWSLVARMRAAGLVRDRSMRFRSYPDCVVAREVVQWFRFTLQVGTVQEAVQLGLALVEGGWLESVSGKDPFQDSDKLFRVRSAATVRQAQSHSPSGSPALSSSGHGGAALSTSSPTLPSRSPSQASPGTLRSFTMRGGRSSFVALRPPPPPRGGQADSGSGSGPPGAQGADAPMGSSKPRQPRASLVGSSMAPQDIHADAGSKPLPSLRADSDPHAVTTISSTQHESSQGSAQHASGRAVADSSTAASGSASAGGAAQSQPPPKSGWLFKKKKGRTFMLWKRRWFVLRGVILEWYRKQGDAVPAGCIDTSTFRITIDATFKSHNTLLVLPRDISRGKTDQYLLQGKDKADALAWMSAVRQACEGQA
ncbi:Pikfyve [Symbiodinium sp. KB8]|nr:Pikfyve [Symbiodinium sp. KB8]